MNCTHHIQNRISLICIAPHRCSFQRKLCVDCLPDHEVDIKQTVPIKKFQEMIIKKLKESKPYQVSELTNQRIAFKTLLSQTEKMIKNTWEDLSQSIQQIYDWIEKEDKSYINLINNNTNLAESSYTNIEKLVSIVVGEALDYWKAQKNSYIMEQEQTKNLWDQDVKAFIQKSTEGTIKIQPLIKIQSNQGEGKYHYKQYKIQSNKEEGGIKLNGDLLFNFKWKILKIQELNKLSTSEVYSVCFSSDGTTLASAGKNDVVLWNVKTGKYKARLLTKSADYFSVCFSPDGTTLAASGGRGRKSDIFLFDVKKEINKSIFFGIIYSICFSPDGTKLAFGGSDKSIYLWEVITEEKQAIFTGHTHWVQSVCFSPDGTTLASGSLDTSIRLWDIKTKLQIANLDGHTSYVQSVCFSPDGKTLASGSSDNSIRLWDVKTMKQKSKLDGHLYQIKSVCFSPDGTTLASCSFDKSIRLWDVQTGQQKAKSDDQSDCINSIYFSHDGTTLASGGIFLRLWGVQWENQVELPQKTSQTCIIQ